MVRNVIIMFFLFVIYYNVFLFGGFYLRKKKDLSSVSNCQNFQRMCIYKMPNKFFRKKQNK